MQGIKYYSTNRNSELATFSEALIAGQAPDRGLYMPTVIPKMSQDRISSMRDMPYSDIAFTVINEFIKNDVCEGKLRGITERAYNFDVPLEKIVGNNYIMRLDQGPTASFKDFSARVMARLMGYFAEKENKELTVLVATSGDTGGAVADAFYSLDYVSVVVLFPEKEVTPIQRKQITSLDKNIKSVAIKGTFDDCQAMVKQAFSDKELRYLNLSSANSINFGRLLPQIVYYFYAYSRLSKDNEDVIFSIPSGNFGNMTGCLFAKRMGLPVNKFIVAVNENDEFPRFLETGGYAPIKPSKACISNSMNVGHPNNLARVIDLYGGQMDEKGGINRMPDIGIMRKDIFSVSISDYETVETMKHAYKDYNKILEPHGAVSWAALERFLPQNKDAVLSVALETAHPAKFNEEVKKILGFEPEFPKSMKDLKDKEERFENISADYGQFKAFLRDTAK